MVNKRFTVAFGDINSLADNVLDILDTQTVTSVTGNTDVRDWYPKEIQIINDCGAGVEWLIIANELEYADYVANPSSFVFVRLPSGYALQDNFNSLGRCYKFIVKGYKASATSSLILEFISYRASLK